MSEMLSPPRTLNESDNGGRGLSAVTPPPALQLVEQTGVFSPRSSASSSPPPPCASSSFSAHHSLLSSPSSLTPPFPRLPPLLSTPSPPPCSPAPLPRLLHHHSSPPRPSELCPPLFSSSAQITPLLLSAPPPVSPLLPLYPVLPPSAPPLAPPPPSCPCSSLLPRLLSAHRLEVRRLLRGALASLGRRLDSLERRSRRKDRWRKQRLGGACFPASTSSSTSTSTSASSSSSSTAPPLSCFSQSDQRREGGRDHKEEVRGRKRKRKIREDKVQEEEHPGRFVGQMAVSFREGGGVEEEAPLTLHNFNQRGKGGAGQLEKTGGLISRRNGYSSSSLGSAQTCSQSEAFAVSSNQWWFSDFTPPISSLSALCLRFPSSSSSSSPPSFSTAPMLQLSVVAMETMLDSLRGGACGVPLRPLKDWTAPPSLSDDHCYVRTSPSLTFSTRRQQKQRANRSTRSLRLPWSRPLPLPTCSANGPSAPFPASQSAAGSEFLSTNGECGKRVSQIRIRRASPRETPLTPMGLPKVKRLKKKEFSLEEIYTNKNYRSPCSNRSLETIFEEPREKDGALLLIGQQRRRRLLLFPDFTQPRKRKRPQGAWLPGGMAPRKRAAARRHCHGDCSPDDDGDLDVMLVERLSALEDFLTQQGLDV
ncbi:uncharacterized protein wu:fi75a02 isoform X2 [Scophthalmus maximus]|uniref:uncharacterized protein wu:fi75a02 isoform X2 n=1 Tax=Scophthalmus maximus TaxID=52904 RepID=UPI0015E10A47|nr:uncharacterized protein wu:fi75a02 isoform X2 [Scophthalmus maximus]